MPTILNFTMIDFILWVLIIYNGYMGYRNWRLAKRMKKHIDHWAIRSTCNDFIFEHFYEPNMVDSEHSLHCKNYFECPYMEKFVDRNIEIRQQYGDIMDMEKKEVGNPNKTR